MADLAVTPFLPTDVTESQIVVAIASTRGKEWLQRLLAVYAQLYRCWLEKPRGVSTDAEWNKVITMWNNWRISTDDPHEYDLIENRTQFRARQSKLRASIRKNKGSNEMISQVEELVRARKEELEAAQA